MFHVQSCIHEDSEKDHESIIEAFSEYGPQPLMHYSIVVVYINSEKILAKYRLAQRKSMIFNQIFTFTQINPHSLENISFQYNNFHSFSNIKNASVIVFDLDDTLIDKDNLPLWTDTRQAILECHKLFDFVILWSFGKSEHVYHGLRQCSLSESDFNWIITRRYFSDDLDCKGLGYIFNLLHAQFKVVSLHYSVLVDDLPENSSNEYTRFIQIRERDKYKSSLIEFLTPTFNSLKKSLSRNIFQ